MTAFTDPETGALSETVSMAGDGYPFRHDSQELIQRLKAGDYDARQKLITGSLRQVLHSHNGYAHSRVGIFDLLKAGNRGLAHALESFKAECDGRFSAYAASCIRRHIEHMLNLATV